MAWITSAVFSVVAPTKWPSFKWLVFLYIIYNIYIIYIIYIYNIYGGFQTWCYPLSKKNVFFLKSIYKWMIWGPISGNLHIWLFSGSMFIYQRVIQNIKLVTYSTLSHKNSRSCWKLWTRPKTSYHILPGVTESIYVRDVQLCYEVTSSGSSQWVAHSRRSIMGYQMISIIPQKQKDGTKKYKE